MIAFDINGTLIKRISKNDKETLYMLESNGIYSHGNIQSLKIFLRPHLEILSEFLDSHKIPYVFWSNCQERNVRRIHEYLSPIFSNVKGYLSYEDCKEGDWKDMKKCDRWVKDLNKLERFWDHDTAFGSKFDVNICWLVDDSIEKRMSNQNFMHVKTFDGYPDDEIFRICDQLHDVYKCDDLNCIKKFKI